MAPTDVNKAAQAAMRDVAQQYGDGVLPVPVYFMPLPSAWADAGLLHQLFVNLISNAVKFSSQMPNGKVHIGCLHENPETEPVYFVRDEGPGFDPQQAANLFVPFAPREKTRQAGLGVGLTIVKRIVSRHHGRIWAEADPGEGATFFFTLGKPPAQDLEKAETFAKSRQARKRPAHV